MLITLIASTHTKNHTLINQKYGFCIEADYILRRKTTLSEKITFPATKPTIEMIGKLIVAPAIPVDIPIKIDRPKDRKIITKAYQPGKAPYKTVAMQPVQT